MIPIPGGSQDTEGQLVRDLRNSFVVFLCGPWISVELMQQQLQGQAGTRMQVTYQYEAYAGFRHMDGAPILLFCAPGDFP